MIRARLPPRMGAACLAAAAGGCVPAPACDGVCEVALDRYGTCLGEWGLDWGPTVGYTDPDD